MRKNDIGINAGTIWHLLADKGVLSISQICEYTNSEEASVMLALGWLSRENKIRFLEKQEIMYVELKNYPGSEMYF